MSTWISDVFHSHRLQLATTAIVSGALVAGAILGLQTAKREYKIYDLKESIPGFNEAHDVEKVCIITHLKGTNTSILTT